MDFLCKLSFHKYKIIKRLNGGDYPKCIEECERCGQNFVVTYRRFGNTKVVDIENKEN